MAPYDLQRGDDLEGHGSITVLGAVKAGTWFLPDLKAWIGQDGWLVDTVPRFTDSASAK